MNDYEPTGPVDRIQRWCGGAGGRGPGQSQLGQVEKNGSLEAAQYLGGSQ